MDDNTTYKIVDGKRVPVQISAPTGRITDDRLPHRFGNRKTRRKMQSEIRKIK